ncbi:hypothetical protein [Marinigracilibium pacificum]|uniref:Uncharacterized protein n=1 Tax=Marinigracilibium pacificum TaxID=2729599 RepID=A0A848IRB2_9BACT|nr:hypothetical protein [Marinigracilibium pacificum]NMM46897.1 hypothetical protein [Marinigracilibium pacificum]
MTTSAGWISRLSILVFFLMFCNAQEILGQDVMPNKKLERKSAPQHQTKGSPKIRKKPKGPKTVKKQNRKNKTTDRPSQTGFLYKIKPRTTNRVSNRVLDIKINPRTTKRRSNIVHDSNVRAKTTPKRNVNVPDVNISPQGTGRNKRARDINITPRTTKRSRIARDINVSPRSVRRNNRASDIQVSPRTTKRSRIAKDFNVIPRSIRPNNNRQQDISVNPRTTRRSKVARDVSVSPRTTRRSQTSRDVSVSPRTTQRSRSARDISVTPRSISGRGNNVRDISVTPRSYNRGRTVRDISVTPRSVSGNRNLVRDNRVKPRSVGRSNLVRDVAANPRTSRRSSLVRDREITPRSISRGEVAGQRNEKAIQQNRPVNLYTNYSGFQKRTKGRKKAGPESQYQGNLNLRKVGLFDESYLLYDGNIKQKRLVDNRQGIKYKGKVIKTRGPSSNDANFNYTGNLKYNTLKKRNAARKDAVKKANAYQGRQKGLTPKGKERHYRNVTAKIEREEGRTKVLKPVKGAHPTAKFKGDNEQYKGADNPAGNRVKKFWYSLFDKKLQPAHIRKKSKKQKYDKGEKVLWEYDLDRNKRRKRPETGDKSVDN